MTLHAGACLRHIASNGVRTEALLVGRDKARSGKSAVLFLKDRNGKEWQALFPWDDFEVIRDGLGRAIPGLNLRLSEEMEDEIWIAKLK